MRRTYDHLLVQARLSSGAALVAEVAGGTSVATGFSHAVGLAQFIEDAMISSQTGLRRTLGDWPSA